MGHEYRMYIIIIGSDKQMSGMMKSNRAQQKESKYIEQPIRTVDGEVRIKKYVQLKLVGSGSYSKCFLVKNTDSDSTYVAKIIPKKKLQILQKQKLIYEIKIHQSLSHHNVVHLDHWFEDDTNQYIFMEYCPNGNLQTKLAQADGSMQEEDIRRYGCQIVQAIAYIHSQNILHRDLKLCNFYLDQEDNVKLGDFGFACQLASEYDKKRETCGTPNYIAPEAISGFGYSFSSDVWAIGVILYRLKYGCCPFEGQNVKKTLENVKLCNFKFPSRPKISSELKDLIQKIFNLNYDQRLTTDEIMVHEFFEGGLKSSPRNTKELKQEKRGFSLSRLFSLDKGRDREKQSKEGKQKSKKGESDQKGRQGILERETRNSSAQGNKKQQPKRSNSCETFKQIKQIFKNKSKQNLATSGSVPSKKDSISSPYYTLSTVVCTNRQRDLCSSKTNRASIMEYSYSLGFNQTAMDSTNPDKGGLKKQENTRSNRLNQFIKTTVNSTTLKEQLKLSKKLNTSKNSINGSTNVSLSANQTKIESSHQGANQPALNPNSICLAKNTGGKAGSTGNSMGSNYINSAQKLVRGPSQAQQQLFNYSRKYYLPLWIQQEKDFMIVHYKPWMKQILYMNSGYILHRSPHCLYKMTGEPVPISDLPKVFKYVIENKVEIKDHDREAQYQYADDDISKAVQYMPQASLVLKDGVIFKYGTYSQVLVAKLLAQDGFYIHEDNAQPIMYGVDTDSQFKLVEGVVVMRIYSGWVKTYCKK